MNEKRFIWFALICTALVINLTRITHAQLDYSTSWVGNTWGGTNNLFVQQNVADITVATNGMVYTNTEWEEGGAGVCSYQNGQRVQVAGHTNGWGYHGGDAITANSTYLYFAQYVQRDGGTDPNTWPASTNTWYGVARRPLSDITQAASFTGGKGGSGDTLPSSFLLINDVANGTNAAILGLAANGSYLFVSDPFNSRILVYDANSMAYLRQWSCANCYRLALDSSGYLWVLTNGSTPKIIRYDSNGNLQSQQITFASGVVPAAMAYDATNNRLLVADAGANLNIKIYNLGSLSGNPTNVSSTFGATGGLFSGTPGLVGPTNPPKFSKLAGIGIDSSGNIYAASTITGTVLESYAPGGSRNWALLGLEFIDSAAIDPGAEQDVYTKEEHFTMNYTAPAGQNWSYTGCTLNWMKYPDDPRLHDGSSPTAQAVRRINGQKFLVLNDQGAGYMMVYRFNAATDGEVAIPCVMVAKDSSGSWPPTKPASGDWVWVDSDGDGQFDANEFQQNNPPSQPFSGDQQGQGWWMDTNGDIWQCGAGGIRHFICQGLNASGVPQYSYAAGAMETFAAPAPFDIAGGLQRVMYDPSTDALYLTGYTSAYPNNPSMWKIAGRVAGRYSNWRGGNRTATWTALLPWDGTWNSTVAVDIAGNYLFTIGCGTRIATIFRLDNGQTVGTITPDSNVATWEGWVDAPYGMSAHLLSGTNEYIMLNEEVFKAKVLMEHWYSNDDIAPVVSITSPTNNAAFTAPASITINATASDVDGTVSKVEFYQGSTLLGTDSTSPYSYTWTNVAQGNYSLTAKAYDNLSVVTTSSPVNITVAATLPDAIVTDISWSPANPLPGDAVTFSATVKNQGTGATPVGVIVGIGFAVDGTTVNWSDNNSTSLAAGASRVQTANGGPSGSIWTATAGTHTIMATVDDINRFAESDETNNSYSEQLIVPSQVATPTFNPGAGTYSSAQTVTISCTTTGATIRYTTDGTTPSETVGTVGNSVTISTSCTLKAIAYKTGMTDSSIASGVYTINPFPTTGMLLWLKADALALNNNDPVTTWADASGNGRNAVFTQVGGVGVAPVFTTNVFNGKPVVRFNGNSLLQVSALPLGTYTIVAVFKTTSNNEIVYEHGDDMNVNPTGNFLFTSTTSTVSVKRAGTQTGKDIAESNASTWAANPGVAIMTMDQFDGTDAGEKLFINTAPQLLNENYVGNLNTTASTSLHFNIGLRASWGGLQFHGDLAEIIVYDHALNTTDTNQLNSALMSKYALDTPPAVSITSPANNATFTSPASVTINATASDTDGTVNKVEFYQGITLLGTDSTSPYSYPWTNVAAGSYALTALAYDNNNVTTASSVVNITVSDPCAAPTFSPAAGTFTTSTAVTISTTTGGASIRYTTDGTTPTSTVGTVYSSPVSITATCTLKAIAYKSGMADSTVTSGVYTIQCATPTFSPAAGTYSSTQTVTISSATGGVTIRYTTDGTTPSSTVGTVGTSVTISSSCTLKAIAYKTGLSDSAVASGVYTINSLPTTGMLLWLKADALALNNNDPVNTWTDSSGNGRNAVYTHPFSEVAPVFTTNVFNGKPVVRFNGNSLLQVSSLPIGPFTIVAVFKTTTSGELLYEHSDNSVGNDGCMFYTSTNSTVGVKRGTQTGKDLLGANASTWASSCSAPILAVHEFGGTDASEVLYLNNAQQQLMQTYTGAINNSNVVTAHFNIGERAQYANLQFHGDIAEIVVYDHVLSSADLTAVNSALSSKYALDTPPTVSITAPANNSTYTAPASVTITAAATPVTGSISKVEFFDGNTLIGTATTSPYSINWSNAENGGGSVALTAKAYDSAGFATVSSAVNITINDTNLKAYWKLDEDTGTSTADASGTGNTGTIANGSWQPGKINCCVSFNGTSSSIQKTSASSLPAANATQTIGFWLYVSATPSAKATAMAVSGSSSGVYIGYSDSTHFGVWKNNGTLLVSTTALPSFNAWHYITYVKNGSNNYLYIDGTQVNTSTTATDSSAATTLTAGMTPGGTNYFNGKLDEIRVYTRALSATEISGLAAGKQ